MYPSEYSVGTDLGVIIFRESIISREKELLVFNSSILLLFTFLLQPKINTQNNIKYLDINFN